MIPLQKFSQRAHSWAYSQSTFCFQLLWCLNPSLFSESEAPYYNTCYTIIIQLDLSQCITENADVSFQKNIGILGIWLLGYSSHHICFSNCQTQSWHHCFGPVIFLTLFSVRFQQKETISVIETAMYLLVLSNKVWSWPQGWETLMLITTYLLLGN